MKQKHLLKISNQLAIKAYMDSHWPALVIVIGVPNSSTLSCCSMIIMTKNVSLHYKIVLILYTFHITWSLSKVKKRDGARSPFQIPSSQVHGVSPGFLIPWALCYLFFWHVSKLGCYWRYLHPHQIHTGVKLHVESHIYNFGVRLLPSLPGILSGLPFVNR